MNAKKITVGTLALSALAAIGWGIYTIVAGDDDDVAQVAEDSMEEEKSES